MLKAPRPLVLYISVGWRVSRSSQNSPTRSSIDSCFQSTTLHKITFAMASLTSSISRNTTAPLMLETWKGPLTSWTPPASCSRVTEATETHLVTNFRSSTSRERTFFDYRWPQERSGLWEGDVRSCFPPYIGRATNYYYPGSCPVEYVSIRT